MKIGILQCDDVIDKLQPQHGNYPAMFGKLLHNQDPSLELIIYRAIDNELPRDVDECDAYMTTGSRHSVNDPYEWISRLEDFIHQLYIANKKLVGICFGHQLIAKALGGRVGKASQGWGVGVATQDVILVPDWLSKASEGAVPKKLSLLISHQDQVINLPKDSQILAGSSFCPYAVLQIKQQFLGIQGHPEFSKDYARDLMMSRQSILPDLVIKNGLQSFAENVDSDLVAQWMLSFLRQSISD